MAENESAPLPTWTKGQTWAVGGERDLSSVLQENLGTLQDALSVLGSVSVDKLILNGNASAWTVLKVAEVRQDTYLLEYSVGVHVKGGVQLSVTGDLPEEGVYLLSKMVMQSKTVTLDACLNLCLTSHGYVTIDKSTMAIQSVSASTIVDERLTFDATNFPSYSTSISMNGIAVNMSYADFAINECLHLEMTNCITFEPALQILQFPLTVGDKWAIDSTMTVAGTAKGYFNATGLPSSMTSAFATKDGSFTGSVRIQDLTKLGDITLTDGTFTPVKQDIAATMECNGTKQIDDGAGNLITVFDVMEKQTGVHLFYSPDKMFLVGALVKPQMDMLNGMMTMPDSSLTGAMNLNTEVTMAPASPTSATTQIAQIGADQGVEPISLVTPDNTGTGSSGPVSTYGLFEIAIVIVAALIGAVLLFRLIKKKKP
jgi:hypothetical protein